MKNTLVYLEGLDMPRPRLPTLDELRQQSSLEVQNKRKGGKLPTGIKELKEMYKLQNKAKGEAGHIYP